MNVKQFLQTATSSFVNDQNSVGFVLISCRLMKDEEGIAIDFTTSGLSDEQILELAEQVHKKYKVVASVGAFTSLKRKPKNLAKEKAKKS